MRVAYQAGVVRKLSDRGLRFDHIDGTSGGIFNLAMLLSGATPTEMCTRWRTLPVHDFMSFLPFIDYVRSPHLPALGSAEGLRDKVFPHLGVDVAAIRSATGLQGTFNVCNYTRKTNEVVEHREVALDLLIAGVSLPIFLPAVSRGATLYMDSVWIRDANIPEAIRRGAEEIWLVWCIGNISEYRNGPFNQYVHMIEIAANGRLFEDFEQLRVINVARSAAGASPIRVHVIKPRYPLPLDPEYYLGEITGEELVSMGYRDAATYLREMEPDGVSLTPEATHMELPPPRSRTLEILTAPSWDQPEATREPGETDGGIELRLVTEMYEAVSAQPPECIGRVCGTVSLPGLAPDLPIDGGDVVRALPADSLGYAVTYSSEFQSADTRYLLEVHRRHDGRGGGTTVVADVYPVGDPAASRRAHLSEAFADRIQVVDALGVVTPASLVARMMARLSRWFRRPRESEHRPRR